MVVQPSRVVLMGLLSFIFGCGSGPYHKKDGSWWWKDDRMRVHASVRLTPLSDLFATAGERAYYRGDAIEGSDAATFVVLDERYAKDKRAAYYCDTFRKDQEFWLVKRGQTRVIDGADAATFVMLGQRYARDATRAYYEGVNFPVRDAATFEPLDNNYARDHQTGYYIRLEVKGSDGPTFEGLDAHYARDKIHVWYSDLVRDGGPHFGEVANVVLADADRATFAVMEKGYAKDAQRVYYNGKLLKGADAATFAVLDVSTDSADAKDARNGYLQGRKGK